MLNKVVGFPIQDTAVGWYRIIQPIGALKRLELTKEGRSIPFSGDRQLQAMAWNPRLYTELCDGADILWTTVVYNTDDLQRILNLREQYGLKWVVDVDDNLFAVSRDNPAADHVSKLKKYIQRCLSMADGLTVSVPSLKKLYAPLNDNILVVPNGLYFDKPYLNMKPAQKSWDELAKAPKKRHKGIRIGWEGAYGHKMDLEMVKPVIEALQANYDVTFVAFGWRPEMKCEWHDWVEFGQYPAKLASLNLDIGISPLVDSSYNRCKSNLRYLEFSALGVPTVISPTENQKGMVTLEASSLHEWYEQLQKLIEDPALRKQLGKEAHAFVREQYDIHKIVPELAEWFENLPRRTDLVPDLKPSKE